MRRIVVIVGGGISGLAAAHRLCELKRQRRLNLKITLLEASARFGGLIETARQDGFLLEAGPDGFLSDKPGAQDLCRRIGLAGELVQTRPKFRRLYVFRRGRMIEFGQCGEDLRRQLARRFYGMEHGSPRYGSFLTLRAGLGRMVERLLQAMPEVERRPSTPLRQLDRNRTGWRLQLEGGEALEADAVCLALPPPQAAAGLKAVLPKAAKLLEQVRCAPVATVNLAFQRAKLPPLPNGLGYVVPAEEVATVLGCTFSHLKFPDRAPDGAALLRLFIGGPIRPEAVFRQDRPLIRQALSELKAHLGLSTDPEWVRIRRYSGAIPIYPTGHSEQIGMMLERELAGTPGLYLAACEGVGLPDRIRQAEAAADRIVG